MAEKMIGVDELATRLGVSRRTIYRWIDSEILPNAETTQPATWRESVIAEWRALAGDGFPRQEVEDFDRDVEEAKADTDWTDIPVRPKPGRPRKNKTTFTDYEVEQMKRCTLALHFAMVKVRGVARKGFKQQPIPTGEVWEYPAAAAVMLVEQGLAEFVRWEEKAENG